MSGVQGIEIKRFKCPKCGGYRFGSTLNADGSWTRFCNSMVTDVQRCDYEASDKDDDKHMVPTGNFLPLTLAGSAWVQK